MSVLSRFIPLALLCAPLCAAPALATEKVYVAENFFIWDLYGYPNSFEGVYYTCFSAVSAAQVDGQMFSIDGQGRYSFVDPITQYVQVLLQLPVDGVEVAAHAGDALFAGSDGTIVRMDADSKLIKGGLELGAPISAMAVHGDELWLGGPDGKLWLGDAWGGGFQLVGQLGAPIRSLLAFDQQLFVGGADGSIARCAFATHALEPAFTTLNDAQSMAQSEGLLLIGGSDGTIQRHDPVSGQPSSPLLREFPVLALFNYDNPKQIELHNVVHSSSIAQGVDVDLQIDAGPEHAGEFYLLLGSFTPAWFPGQGLSADGVFVPLQVDSYFLLTLTGGTSSFLSGARGILPASGQASAKFKLAPHVLPWVSVMHAAVSIDLGAGIVRASSTWTQIAAF